MSDDQDLITRFASIYTGAASDVLDQMNFHHQALPSDLRGLTTNARVVGFALPVVGHATTSADQEKTFVPILQMLGAVGPQQVVVIQANDSECSHLGELSATAIKARGGSGAVVYGGVRDIEYIRQLGLGVFCRYTTPTDVVGRWCLDSYGVPIDIGGVVIRPGDVVLGDADGVLIVPREIATEVLERAESIVNTENYVREAVKNGMHPLDAYRQYGWF
jgi:regulator of RNase E activity RraA